MNKVYFIGPIAALCLFIGVYSVHRGDFEEREAAKVAAVAAAKDARLEAERAAQKAAMAEAIQAAERRNVEKAAKEAAEKAEREVRQVAVDARDKAYREQEKLARQIERLKKDIEAEQAAITKIAAERRATDSEQAFLRDFVAKAQANVQALQALLIKLDAPASAPVPASSSATR